MVVAPASSLDQLGASAGQCGHRAGGAPESAPGLFMPAAKTSGLTPPDLMTVKVTSASAPDLALTTPSLTTETLSAPGPLNVPGDTTGNEKTVLVWTL